jgi:hypothetical protein
MEGVELVTSVGGPAPPDLEGRRDSYWRFQEALFGGLLRTRDDTIYGLGLPLIRLGPGRFSGETWSWPITGGLLARRPGGEIGFGLRNGRLTSFLAGYQPRLPAPVYKLTQRPLHQLITRLFLLQQRGRRHPPGVPAPPALRLAAGAIDATIVLAAVRLLGRRRGIVLGGAYLAGSWARDGRTLGDRLLGLRVVSSDGSGLTPGQAALRLLALPASAVKLRALHDELAGTEVVVDRSGRL